MCVLYRFWQPISYLVKTMFATGANYSNRIFFFAIQGDCPAEMHLKYKRKKPRPLFIPYLRGRGTGV